MTSTPTDIAAWVPALVEGVDRGALKLDVMERLVLDHVDGRASLDEICDATGLLPEQALGLLERLTNRGVVAIRTIARPPPSGPVASKDSIPPPPVADPMSEPADLSTDARQRILAYEARLEQSFYELLDVPRDTDRKAVRGRYFALSKDFHPDSYFGKNLGSFRRRLERIFARLTLAYEVLSHVERRSEYDGYLGERLELDDARRRIEESRQQAEGMRQQMRERVHRAREVARRSRLDDKSRKAHLARKLAAGRRLGSPSTPPRRDPRETAEAVRRLLGESGFTERHRQAEELGREAAAAFQADDFVAAANDFRMALALEPRNDAFRARYNEAAARARAQLAAGYFKQGRFEESLGDSIAAVQHYCLAAEQDDSNPDYPMHAASLLLKLGQDLHRAREMAIRAARLRPNDARCHQLLGLIYMEAGLGQSARREFEAALLLEPNSDTLKEHLRTARKLG